MFQILIGGKSPERRAAQKQKILAEKSEKKMDEIEKQLKTDNISPHNWVNCEYRSEKEKTVIKGCCSQSSEIFCHNCKKLSILNLTPLVCARCNFFKQKEIINEENKEKK